MRGQDTPGLLPGVSTCWWARGTGSCSPRPSHTTACMSPPHLRETPEGADFAEDWLLALHHLKVRHLKVQVKDVTGLSAATHEALSGFGVEVNTGLLCRCAAVHGEGGADK